ncbi:pyrroline-5-carboxylate reductase [Caulobacter sp. BE264]|uniref:pyrroline-5-carboxylate reductase n=1 Tax=Caulobacter sp. BE264 TaxID=2817724 RepID=UPI00285A5503|nr:pyrroline-5-carboxylate reductase [Caulobacter sp. BE264]MDR7231524.1 pyrroline-5-carboxylate reductase [Caulobacter sp. BE264]
MTPILLLGAGRMGGALIQGWRAAGAFQASDLIIRDPHVDAAAFAGAVVNPPLESLSAAKTVLLAVKPQIWREAIEDVVPHLAPDAVIVSIAAGVRAADISQAFGGRRVARVMPTTAVAIGRGAASLYADDAEALARAQALFAPVAVVAILPAEDLMHAATAVSGSAPAYLYAFIEALEAAGAAQGLESAESARLARATIIGAAALMAQSGEEPAELRKQVTSPGGTTAAALSVLMGEGGFGDLLPKALDAAVARSKELGG